MSMRPRVLVIAGSDSSGGAGLLRDVQVLSELNVDVLCAVTAVTAQTDARVDATHAVPPELVRQQISNAFEIGGIGAVKIGMLVNSAIVEAVASALPSRKAIPIVLDPVLVSSSGAALLDDAGVIALKELLLPRCTLATPNLSEAAVLLDDSVALTEAAMVEQAQRILRMGCQGVLLKGGHSIGNEAVDVLVTATKPPRRLPAERVNAQLRGTGCALSSAIAAHLAMQASLTPACESGKNYVLGKLRNAQASTSAGEPRRSACNSSD